MRRRALGLLAGLLLALAVVMLREREITGPMAIR